MPVRCDGHVSPADFTSCSGQSFKTIEQMDDMDANGLALHQLMTTCRLNVKPDCPRCKQMVKRGMAKRNVKKIAGNWSTQCQNTWSKAATKAYQTSLFNGVPKDFLWRHNKSSRSMFSWHQDLERTVRDLHMVKYTFCFSIIFGTQQMTF